MNIPDNYDYFKKHQDELDDKLEELPSCEYCGEAIQSNKCYLIDNEVLCHECLDEHYSVRVEDLKGD